MVKTEALQMHVQELLLKKRIWNKAPALKIHPRSKEARQKQQLAVVVFFASLKLGEDWNFIVNYLAIWDDAGYNNKILNLPFPHQCFQCFHFT